ncbi:MAG: hypothetical protein RR404_00615 [Bacilli bacterium]
MTLEEFIKLNNLYNDTIEVKVLNGKVYFILDNGELVECVKELIVKD